MSYNVTIDDEALKALTDRIASLEAENMRLRNQQEIIGEALMRDPPFDVYHGVDLHETASAAAEDDGRCGDIASRDYFAALFECCAQALLGGWE